ncbi:MAG TPA: N-formylglutamate deformylase [Woeseiaceae bacterium]|nr:N-formylglutamate deformylase [Woeseiaceae bacterium]
MTAVFSYTPGSTPLLISIPHDGRQLPPEVASGMTATGKAIPDTDWHVIRLYAFAGDLGASVISANYSRYVVDLNRPASDEALYTGQVSTGLCPVASFAGDPLYQPGREPSPAERATRTEAYWRPYHERLAAALDETRARFGYALLWDAHSIPGEVPLLFPGRLPDLNIGTNDGRSCDEALQTAVMAATVGATYSSVLNGRFKGGYITRHYGRPERQVHAVQLELAQRCYMDEKSLRYDDRAAAKLGDTIRRMLQAYLASATSAYGG